MIFHKKLSIPFLLSVLVGLSSMGLKAQNTPMLKQQSIANQRGLELQELSVSKLPEKIRNYVDEQYKEAEISKAYKVKRPNSKRPEYWLDLIEGDRKWSLQFNAEGNIIGGKKE